MSHSTSPSEYSADESGYITSRLRRNHSTSEEYDPSEDSNATTNETPVQSSTPVSSLPALRVQVTTRKSVPLPVRVTFPVPPRDGGDPSRSRTRGVTPPPVTGVPVERPSGMTRFREQMGLKHGLAIQKT